MPSRAAAQRAASTGLLLTDLERDHFGLTATQAFAHLLRLWGLPPVLAGWVGQSGEAAALPLTGFSVPGLVHVAGGIVDMLDQHDLPEATRASLDQMGLTGRLETWGTVAAVAVGRAA